MTTITTEAFVNGRWTTQSVDVAAILQGNVKNPEVKQKLPDPPFLGVLTQTVIESPAVHWVLPITLQRNDSQHVASIGDHLVKILSFKVSPNAHLEEVARLDGVGSRIRNARVMDIPDAWMGADRDQAGDVAMVDSGDKYHIDLPPQCIVLALESGDLVFLLPRQCGDRIELDITKHIVPHPMLTEQPGTHLAVDPSSRFIATGCSESTFTLLELSSGTDDHDRMASPKSFKPIKNIRHFNIDGVIHKMDFLYPQPDDPDHMILLLLIVRKGNTRMKIWEWDANRGLSDASTRFPHGHQIPSPHRLPLLLVPIKIRSSFILILAENFVACEGLLEGSPTFEPLSIKHREPTRRHFGLGQPLWTAWSKPARTVSYSETHDDIYVAREDGFVKFLEINSEDDVLMMDAGCILSNIGTGFVALGADLALGNAAADFFIATSDCGTGSVYRVDAKEYPTYLGPLANCSPIFDFTTIKNRRSPLQNGTGQTTAATKYVLREPERTFTCAGKGLHSSLTELRYGYNYMLRMEFTTLNATVKKMWGLASPSPCDLEGPNLDGLPMLFLISLGNRCQLFDLYLDLNTVQEVSQSETWMDLGSSTVAASAWNGFYVQITERSVNACSGPIHYISSGTLSEPLSVSKPMDGIIGASIYRDRVALIAYSSSPQKFSLNLYTFGKTRKTPTITEVGRPLHLAMYPISLEIVEIGDNKLFGVVGFAGDTNFAGVGTYQSTATVRIYDLTSEWAIQDAILEIKCPRQRERGDDYDLPDACASLAVLGDGLPTTHRTLLVGHRSGYLTAIRLSLGADGKIRHHSIMNASIGPMPVTVTAEVGNHGAVLTCGTKAYKITHDHCDMHRIWITDVSHPHLAQPPVSLVTTLPHGLLLLTGKELLLTWPDNLPQSIPRTIRLPGSPTRLIYSHDGVLIVGMASAGEVTTKGHPMIMFIDPDTGEADVKHTNSGTLVLPDSISKGSDRILCMAECDRTMYDETDPLDYNDVDPMEYHDYVNSLIVIGTSGGHLLIYDRRTNSDNMIHTKLRIKETFSSPVSAVSVKGWTEITFCSGRNLHVWYLDPSNWVLRRGHKTRLHSTAVSIARSLECPDVVEVATASHSNISFLANKLVPQYADEVARNSLSNIKVSDYSRCLPTSEPCQSGCELHSSSTGSTGGFSKDMTIISDRSCSVTGLWGASSDEKKALATDHTTLFEAELPVSIIKFVLSNTRPTWDMSWHSTPDNYISGVVPLGSGLPDLLGVSLDGTLINFTIIKGHLWRLLAFLQRLARCSKEICPISWERKAERYEEKEENSPLARHIDGDLLRRCLGLGVLERLVEQDEENHREEFKELMVSHKSYCRPTQMENGDEDCDGVSDELDPEFEFETGFHEARVLLGNLLRPVL